MSVDECVKAYRKLSEQALDRAYSRSSSGSANTAFGSVDLDLAIHQLLEDRGLGKDEPLKDKRPGCKVYD